jgi:hypothetical protein
MYSPGEPEDQAAAVYLENLDVLGRIPGIPDSVNLYLGNVLELSHQFPGNSPDLLAGSEY